MLAGVVPQGTSEKRSKEYVLMVHFFVVRFDGASGACQLLQRVFWEGPEKEPLKIVTTLSFLSLIFWKKARKTHQKNKDILFPTEPLKSLEKKGKTLEKKRNSSQGKKQGIPKKQGKEGQGIFKVENSLN